MSRTTYDGRILPNVVIAIAQLGRASNEIAGTGTTGSEPAATVVEMKIDGETPPVGVMAALLGGKAATGVIGTTEV